MRQIDVILTKVILLLFKPIKHSNKLTTALMKIKLVFGPMLCFLIFGPKAQTLKNNSISNRKAGVRGCMGVLDLRA